MKTKYFLITANIILLVLMDFLICYYNGTFNISMIVSLVLLNITLTIPSIYFLCSSRKSLDPSINEVLMPSLIVNTIFMIVNVGVLSYFFSEAAQDYMPLVITEISIFAVFIILLLILFIATNHIRKVYRGDKNE